MDELAQATAMMSLNTDQIPCATIEGSWTEQVDDGGDDSWFTFESIEHALKRWIVHNGISLKHIEAQWINPTTIRARTCARRQCTCEVSCSCVHFNTRATRGNRASACCAWGRFWRLGSALWRASAGMSDFGCLRCLQHACSFHYWCCGRKLFFASLARVWS